MTDQELLQAIGQVVEAKVEPLRQDICELKDRVGMLEYEAGQLKSEIGQLKSEVGQLKGEVSTLQGAHARLEHKVNGIQIYIDVELNRTLNLLLEGQQALWDRFVPQEEFHPLEDRTEVLELTVKRHSHEIRELQLA